jgi:hypothetical protein
VRDRHRHKSLTHKEELKKGGKRLLSPGDMMERTFGGFEDLVASRLVDVIACEEGASRLETWAKIATNLPNSGVFLGKGMYSRRPYKTGKGKAHA